MHSLRASTLIEIEELVSVTMWMLEKRVELTEELMQYLCHVVCTALALVDWRLPGIDV